MPHTKSKKNLSRENFYYEIFAVMYLILKHTCCRSRRIFFLFFVWVQTSVLQCHRSLSSVAETAFELQFWSHHRHGCFTLTLCLQVKKNKGKSLDARTEQYANGLKFPILLFRWWRVVYLFRILHENRCYIRGGGGECLNRSSKL